MRNHVAPTSRRRLLPSVSCLWPGSADGSGWARARRRWLPRALATLTPQAAASPPALERLMRRRAATLPAQGSAMLCPQLCSRGSPGCLGQGRAAKPTTALSCCRALGALELGGHGRMGHWDRSQMAETGANHACGREPLVPVTMAGGVWGICPYGPLLPLPGDLPGSDCGSPGHVLTTAGGGDEASSATR